MDLNCCNKELDVRLETSLISLQTQLGVNCITWFRHDELDPYALYILEYLNKEFIQNGACTILQKLQEFSIIFQEGTEQIVNDEVKDLEFKLGINTSDETYRRDLLILAWGNLMTGLYMTLSYNYSEMFNPSGYQIEDCHSCKQCHGSGVDTSLGSGYWDNNIYYNNSGCGCNK